MPGFIARRCLILDLDLGTRREPQVAVGDDRLAELERTVQRVQEEIEALKNEFLSFKKAFE